MLKNIPWGCKRPSGGTSDPRRSSRPLGGSGSYYYYYDYDYDYDDDYYYYD